MSIKLTQANGGFSGADITSSEWSMAGNSDTADVPRVEIDLTAWLTANSLTADDVIAVRYTSNTSTNPDPRETTGAGVEKFSRDTGAVWIAEDRSSQGWYSIVFPPGGTSFDLNIAILTTSGWTTWSADAKRATVPSRRPFPPETPTVIGASSSSISVDWATLVPEEGDDGGSAITQYDLRWSTSSDMSGATTVTDIADPETVGSLSASTTYYVQVRAVNANGASDWSGIASAATTAGSATAPSAFTVGQWALTNPVTDGDLQVEIDVLPDNGGSVITDLEYELDASGTWVSFGGATTGLYTISGLTNTTSYNVRLRAVNAVGNATASDTKSATPTAPAGGATVVSGLNSATSLTLDHSYTTGTYEDGSPWIVLSGGEVVITATAPLATTTGSGRATNGLMMDYHNKSRFETFGGTWPTSWSGRFGYTGQGWDSDTNVSVTNTLGYNNNLNRDPVVLGGNLTVTTEATLMKAVSKPSPPSTGRPTLDTIELYTIVTSAPASGTIRPGVAADSKSTNLINVADIDMSRVPNLTEVSGGPTLAQCQAAVDGWKYIGYLNMDHSRFAHASDSHSDTYGAYTWGGSSLSFPGLGEVMLQCCTDKFSASEKLAIMKNIVGYAVDIAERLYQGANDSNPDRFHRAGGLNIGQKAIVAVAAALTQNSRLLTISQSQEYFADDARCFYVSQSDVGRTIRDVGREYIQADADAVVPEWGEQHNKQNDRDTRWYASAVDNNYRGINVGAYAPGVLALHAITGGKAASGTGERTNAWFDYLDRMMLRNFFPDTASNDAMVTDRGSALYQGGGSTKTWVKDMWTTHRASVGTTPWDWPSGYGLTS